MPRYRVVQAFSAKQLNGPDNSVMSSGEELVLLRWMGEEHERSAIFVVSHSGKALHGPTYEATSELFETSTEPIDV
jgi:hypothetical protein